MVGDFGLSQMLLDVEVVCANVRTEDEAPATICVTAAGSYSDANALASPNSWQVAEIYAAVWLIG